MTNMTILRATGLKLNGDPVTVGSTAHNAPGKVIAPICVFERIFTGYPKTAYITKFRVILEEAATTSITGNYYIFNAPVYRTGTTEYATGDTLALTSAQLETLQAIIPVSSWVVGTTDTVAIAMEPLDSREAIYSGSSQNLYGLFVNSDTNSVTAASVVKAQIVIEQFN